MTRRRAKTGRTTQADLLAGWLGGPSRSRARPDESAGLFDVPALGHKTSESTDRIVPEPTSATPPFLSTYTVHCYVTVCVKLTGIVAGSHREAAKLAQERFDWNAHDGEVEFVDVQGDEDYSRSVAFTADLEPVY